MKEMGSNIKLGIMEIYDSNWGRMKCGFDISAVEVLKISPLA
jgi:hypothetical protein